MVWTLGKVSVEITVNWLDSDGIAVKTAITNVLHY